jgi:rhodanese-related sulfurtransferase
VAAHPIQNSTPECPEPRGDHRAAGSAGTAVADILARARTRGARAKLAFAGEIEPEEAWRLFAADTAELVDVRTAEERRFVGYVPNSVHVAWATGTAMIRNPHFVRELDWKVRKDAIVLFLCRSAKRSASAAELATTSGWSNAFNILEGFEGDLDDRRHRGTIAGWRLRGLPWVQD